MHIFVAIFLEAWHWANLNVHTVPVCARVCATSTLEANIWEREGRCEGSFYDDVAPPQCMLKFSYRANAQTHSNDRILTRHSCSRNREGCGQCCFQARGSSNDENSQHTRLDHIGDKRFWIAVRFANNSSYPKQVVVNNDHCMRALIIVLNIYSSSFCRLLIPRRGGGSKKGRKMIVRDFSAALETVWDQYFSFTPLYSHLIFRRRFRVSMPIFNRVYNACLSHPYFQYHANAAKRWGIHPLVKVTAVFRHLAYGTSADQLVDFPFCFYHFSFVKPADRTSTSKRLRRLCWTRDRVFVMYASLS